MSDVEKVAQIVFDAMRWAAMQPHGGNVPPEWVGHGNSHAQDRARDAARAALSALGQGEWNAAIEAAAKVHDDQILWWFDRRIPATTKVADEWIAHHEKYAAAIRALRRPAPEGG